MAHIYKGVDMHQLDMFNICEQEVHQEHLLNEVVMSLYNASKVCPSGMLIVGYDPTVICERCTIVEDSFTVRFDMMIVWNGKHTHYINLCDCCLDTVCECEREFQEVNKVGFMPHTVN